MIRSDIFDSFVKIAQEKGMISNDSENSKKKLEKNPRADSLSLSDIEALYGVKPDLSKGMEYENNIMEDAHPNSVIVSPSYDKLNGLVENNIERQNIMLHIVEKTPDGLSTQRKYAEKELMLTLVRLGNDLDNRDKEELRTLADACLLQVHSKIFKKEGQIEYIVGGIAAILGVLYLQQHLGFLNEGFEKNHQKLMNEIDDLLQSSSSWGVGYDFKPEFISLVQDLKNRLASFYDLYQQVKPLVEELQMPKDVDQLKELALQPETDSVLKAYRAFRDAASKLSPYLKTIEQDFSSESFKSQEIADKGWMSSLVDKMQVFHGGKGLVADDFDDVVRALSAYKKSIADILLILQNAQSLERDAQKKIQQSEYENKSQFGEEMKESPGKSKEDIDREVGNMDAELNSMKELGLG